MTVETLTAAALNFAKAEAAVAKSRLEHHELQSKVAAWNRSPILIFGRLFDLTEELKTVLLDQSAEALLAAQVQADAALNVLLTTANKCEFKGLDDA